MVDSCQEEKSILSNCFPAVLAGTHHFWMDTDMVDSCQEEKSILSNCFPAVLVVDRFQGTQRGGTYV
ncbi:MAG: hypothetical protein JRF31_10135, partial [Deltaproteobacteria bacterium]|nr:hypothetical protein [Deltaproteobacteria bacterium]